MKSFRTAVALILLATLAAFTNAADAPASAPTGSNVTETAILKAQLETTRQFQDSFISMGQWTLTGVITVSLALAGFGWYTSKKNYDRDRDSLQREANALRDILDSALKTGIQQTGKALEDALTARQTAIQIAIEKVVQARINGFSATISNLEYEVLELKSTALESEADAAAIKKNYGWAVRLYGQLLALQTKGDIDEYEAPGILDKIRSIVKAPGTRLDAETVNTTVEALSGLPRRHQAACEQLIEDLKRCLQ